MADYEKSLHNVAIHFCDALIPRGQKPERMEKNGREVVFFPIPPRWKAVIKPEAAAQSLNIYYRQTKKTVGLSCWFITRKYCSLDYYYPPGKSIQIIKQKCNDVTNWTICIVVLWSKVQAKPHGGYVTHF